MLLLRAGFSWAGGSGLNVLIVVNQSSTNSVQLGNYYGERRQVPPQNFLRIHWEGSRAAWDYNDFAARLLEPLLAQVAERRLSNQIDYVVLSTDIPYRVVQSGPAQIAGENSTTSALYYGFKPDYAEPSYSIPSCNLPAASSNSYAGSELPFRAGSPDRAVTNAFLTMMLTASNLVEATALVDKGVASDGSFPPQSVILSKSSDPARNVRFYSFDNAIFNTRLRGNYFMYRTNSETPYFFANLLGYEGGHYSFDIQPGTFVPGAIADSLTSYGGRIFEDTGHTTLLAFLAAGACGSYGTVAEPCNYLEKFPSPQAYFYQARGFSLAECYYQSLTNPYQGLLVGEPLAAPFALPPEGSWSDLPRNAVLSAVTNLAIVATGVDATRPVQQVDLFIDGMFWQTLTNIAPQPNNILTVRIGGYPVSYTNASPGATIASVTEGLTGALNSPTATNATKVRAVAHGDRIELQSLDPFLKAAQLPVSASSSAASAPLTTFILTGPMGFLDTQARGIRSFGVSGNPVAGSYVQLSIMSTNGAGTVIGMTNISGTMTLFQMLEQLAQALNSHPALTGPDGLELQDLFDTTPYTPPNQTAQFNLLPRSAGWPAARVQARLATSAELASDPNTTVTLEQNLPDLQARAHLFIAAGATNMTLNFPLDTTLQPDGFHQLTAVIYEGSHVRTQRRVSQDIVIRNRPLAATFTTLMGDEKTALEAILQFGISANTSSIRSIELFSTGGLLNSVTSQSSVTFSVPAAYLGVGLHPFYAVVTAATGAQYRTETKWIRIMDAEPAFSVSVTAPPFKLYWPALAGRSYDILSATNLAVPFQIRATVIPSNSAGQWTASPLTSPAEYYRVKSLY